MNAQDRLKLVNPKRVEPTANPDLLTGGGAADDVTSEITSTSHEQARSIDEANTQVESSPVLALQSAPDIPQCREILNQAILDLVNTASEDPAEPSERNRRAQSHSIMVSPPLDCASKLWMAARQSGRTAELADAPTSIFMFS